MFSKTTAPVTEPTPVEAEPADLIPLSVLQLDLDAPAVGWHDYLKGHGIEVLADDLGRKAVSRADARLLFDEQRKEEARRREVAARQEQQAVERDRAFRAALPKGTHWTEIPVGVSAAEMWVQAEKDAKPKRRTPLEDALAGGGIVFHPIRGDEDQS
jgi:hypothetical protein